MSNLENQYKETIKELQTKWEISKCGFKYLEEKLAASKENEDATKKKMASLTKTYEEAVEKNANDMALLLEEKIDLIERLQLSDSLNTELVAEKAQLKEERDRFEVEKTLLREEIDVLEREEALAKCKICYDRPVQNVLWCGHAACNECYELLNQCHICREPIFRRNPKKIILT